MAYSSRLVSFSFSEQDESHTPLCLVVFSYHALTSLKYLVKYLAPKTSMLNDSIKNTYIYSPPKIYDHLRVESKTQNTSDYSLPLKSKFNGERSMMIRMLVSE